MTTFAMHSCVTTTLPTSCATPRSAAERRSLLLNEAAAFAEPYLEVLPQYRESARSLDDVFADIGVPEAASLVQIRAPAVPECLPAPGGGAAVRAGSARMSSSPAALARARPRRSCCPLSPAWYGSPVDGRRPPRPRGLVAGG